jgi:uncharacterized protein (DUF1697 family)
MAREVQVALLRAVNNVGQRRLPMAELRLVFAAEGALDVETYIQSGNVVYAAPARRADDLAARVQRRILAQRGFTAPVLTRSHDELAAVVANNPFPGDEAALHVMFLADRPSRARLGALDPERSPGDRFVVRGREIYLHLVRGVARSKLDTGYFDRVLGTTSTLRNWRTVTRLLAMCAARAGAPAEAGRSRS